MQTLNNKTMGKLNNMKIGEVRNFGGVILECLEQKHPDDCCTGCYFKESLVRCYDNGVTGTIGACTRACRKDCKDVIFRKVK